MKYFLRTSDVPAMVLAAGIETCVVFAPEGLTAKVKERERTNDFSVMW